MNHPNKPSYVDQKMQERAALLAKPLAVYTSVSERLLIFHLGENQKYALLHQDVERIIVKQKITPIPGLPSLFAGLIYYNSEVWPVIDLHGLFDIKKKADMTNFILIANKTHHYALLVGRIIGQIAYDKTIGLTHLSQNMAADKRPIQGIYQGDITLIDMLAILNLLESVQLNNNLPASTT